MPLLGQASGGFTESSSALRVLHGGIFNSLGVLTDDGFTQANPSVSTGTDISTQVDTAVTGCLSGSVCFSRPDVGSNFIGGPAQPAGDVALSVRPLGLFINSAAGNAYENQPAAASGKLPYMSSQGSYGDALYESQCIEAAAGGIAQGDPITYNVGAELVASVNGFIIPRAVLDGGADQTLDIAARILELANGNAASTTLGIVKLPPDAVQDEVVFDQRI
jgi:hypothetical protein